MSLSIAMIALGPGAKLSVSEMQLELAAKWPELPPAGKVQRKEGTFAFTVGELDVIVGHMPRPIPWSELDGPCQTSWLWPEAAATLKPHKTHLIVTVSGEASPIDRARLLTQATAAIIAGCSAALGVYWGSAGLVISAAMFRDFAVQVLPVGPPVFVWVDFRIGQNEAGQAVGFTRGLADLGLREFEAPASPEPPGELRERLIGLAGYVLEHGLVIKDGDTIGDSATERIRVRYGPSHFGQPGQVMRLEYPAGGEKKAWWKPW